jgi:hypothetical protein
MAAGNIGRSILAVLAGLVFIFATHLGSDEVLHLAGIYPSWDQPMYDQNLNLLAFSYRAVFSILGCYLTARLAPRAPLTHALILGAIGTALSTAAVIGTEGMNLGPRWYPIALAISALPCAFVGGLLYRALHRPAAARGSA